MYVIHLFEFNFVFICYEEYIGMLKPSNIKVIIFFINMLSGKIYCKLGQLPLCSQVVKISSWVHHHFVHGVEMD